MMEPLLKDEEEKLVVTPNNKLVPTKKQKGKIPFKWDKNIIITVILAIFILWFFGRNIVKPFYMGFKYYDLRFEDNVSENNNSNNNTEEDNIIAEEEIPDNSEILSTTYNKIYIDNCLNTSVIRNVFTIPLSEVNNLGNYLFNDISFITTDNTIYGNYQVTYDDVNQLFNVNVVNANICDDVFNREFLRATTLNDELYIYENVNNVMYKWTFEKGNDGDYYFSSITPV